jgi:hypothetical protein
VATGWAELLRRIRRLAAEEREDPEATWKKFQQLAARSERASILKPLVRLGRVLPSRERHVLAVSITRILAPLEWPPEWIQGRAELVDALDALLEEMDPNEPSSFLSLGGLGGDGELTWRVSRIVLYSARNLLHRPCRRDELRTVALLCNTGILINLQSYRRSAKQINQDTAPRPLVDARVRYRNALVNYATAASVLNGAVGAVLFEGLHAPLEDP